MKTNEKEIDKILQKWDQFPALEDEYSETELGCAKVALELLGNLIELPKEMQKDFIIMLTYLARRAFLSEEEKDILFGENFIEDGLAEKILTEGSRTAIILASIEWIDKDCFTQAAALLTDIQREDWSVIVNEWRSQWEPCHSSDAALVQLLAHRCGSGIELNEIDEMSRILHERHPRIEDLFKILDA